MIIELVNRWEVLDIKRNRTAQETGEYIALTLMMSATDHFPLQTFYHVQLRLAAEWAEQATNIIMHGTPTLTVIKED